MTRLRLLQLCAAGGISLCIVARTLSACGDFGGELATPDAGTESGVVVPTPTPDAMITEPGDASVDADATVGPCALDKPFLPPTRESSISTTEPERAARLSLNELELFLTRAVRVDGGGVGPRQVERIVRYTRATKTDPWSAPVQLPALAVDAGATPFGLPDSRPSSMTFISVNRAILGINDGRGATLYATSRTDAGWAAPKALIFAPNTNASFTSEPWYDRSSDTLYMNRSGNGGAHVYTSRLIDAGIYSDPAPLGFGYILAQGGEISPVLTANELTMFFANNDNSTGRTKIYQATRTTAADPFAINSAVELPELNPPGVSTVPSWVSGDGCELYFDRESDIYVARRPTH